MIRYQFYITKRNKNNDKAQSSIKLKNLDNILLRGVLISLNNNNMGKIDFILKYIKVIALSGFP